MLLLIAALLAVDVLTGIWYWNRLNLRFDSSEFNNILTPIATIAGVVIYVITLKYLVDQNRVSYSNSIRANYENRLKQLIEDVRTFNVTLESTGATYGFHEVPNAIATLQKKLYRKEEFLRVLDNYDGSVDLRDLLVNSQEPPLYVQQYFELSELIDMPISKYLFLLKVVKEFIIEIEESPLIEEDKRHFKLAIRNGIMYSIQIPTFVFLVDGIGGKEYSFIRYKLLGRYGELIKLMDAHFYKFKDWFDEKLPNNKYFPK